ncbi:hypothetical protein BGZ73_005553 [Actinomortierella ambigua]|nr:hypothetical protein BGZ73_005553 [Actinomortierella ambigua]
MDPADSTPRQKSPPLYYIKESRGKAKPQELSGSQDLMAAFNLVPLYNVHVRPKFEGNPPNTDPTYFPYISGLPGKNVIRPGNYIRALIENPEKSYGPIHEFGYSTMREAFSLRPGPVPGFDGSVLGTEDDNVPRPTSQYASRIKPEGSTVPTSTGSLAGMSSEGQTPLHVSSHRHHHSHHHSSKSSSPHVDRGDRSERGEDGSREHRHKKKKKKRKHEHEHEHGHNHGHSHEGEQDSEHRKKKKRKRG